MGWANRCVPPALQEGSAHGFDDLLGGEINVTQSLPGSFQGRGSPLWPPPPPSPEAQRVLLSSATAGTETQPEGAVTPQELLTPGPQTWSLSTGQEGGSVLTPRADLTRLPVVTS